MLIINLLLLVALALGCEAACASYPTNLVKWSTMSSWMTAGATVTVAANQKILLDVSPPALSSISIAGSVYVDNANIQVTSKWIKVLAGGALIVGTKACPITAKVVFEFTGPRLAASVSEMGSDPFDNEVLGSKGLAVLSNATFVVYGDWSGPAWTNIATIAKAGSKTIKLKEKISWKAGDTIIITSTDWSEAPATQFDSSVDWMTSKNPLPGADQTEVRTISSVDTTGTVITLTQALNFTHWADQNMFAEVGLLTRRVVFRGDLDSLNSEYGGQLMMRKAKQINIDGAEFTRFGQKGVLGRYPIHFHFIHDAQGLGYSLNQISSHDHFSRSLTIHETYGVTVRDVVSYKTFGHMYFLENGGEYANTFDHCLGAVAYPIPDTQTGYGGVKLQLLPSDNTPAIFWITNPDNIYTNNVAVGGAHGFWMALPQAVLTAKSQAWHPGYAPNRAPLRGFVGNNAHSSGIHGVFIDHGPGADDVPHGNFGYWGQGQGIFQRSTVYKVRSTCLWAVTSTSQSDHLLMDCGEQGVFFNGLTSVVNTVFVGRTGYNGTNTPNKGFLSTIGINTYDVGPGQHSINNVFINYTVTPGVSKSGAHRGGGPGLEPTSKIINATYINANPFAGGSISPGRGSFVWVDTDGSSTGFKPGGVWVSRQQDLALPYNQAGCKYVDDTQGYVCPQSLDSYFQLLMADVTQPFLFTPYPAILLNGTVLSSKSGVTRAQFWDARNASITGKLSVPVQGLKCDIITYANDLCESFFYNMHIRRPVSVKFMYDNIYRATPSKLWIGPQASGPGDWVILSIPYPTTAVFSIIDNQNPTVPWVAVDSYDKIDYGDYFYDKNTERLWILVPTNANVKTSQIQRDKYYDIYIQNGPKVIITATCPNGRCSPTEAKLKMNYPTPSAQLPRVLREQNMYTGNFRACLVKGGSAAKFGVAQMNITHSMDWNNETYFNGIHDLSGYNPHVIIGITNPDGSTTRVNTGIVDSSPTKGGFPVSPAIATALYTGKLFVQINTNRFPNGHIRANFYCTGTCRPPIYNVDAAPCAYGTNWNTSTSVRMLFANGAVQSGASLGKYDPYGNSVFSITKNDTKCGGGALAVQVGSNGQVFINLRVDVTSKTWQYLEFYVRAPYSADGSPAKANPGIYLRTTTKQWSTGLRAVNYALNKVIYDFEGWQLISIPLVDFGVGSDFTLTNIIIKDDNGIPAFFDNVRLTTTKAKITVGGGASLKLGVRPTNECPNTGSADDSSTNEDDSSIAATGSADTTDGGEVYDGGDGSGAVDSGDSLSSTTTTTTTTTSTSTAASTPDSLVKNSAYQISSSFLYACLALIAFLA